ncbi:MAG TPA: glucoamylase family protein [Pyrinomonadaceae bacterium]
MTSLCIAAERNWIERHQALERTRSTLRFFDSRAFQQRGWFYHWLDAKTGERRWNSEVSSIDTALLLAGVLTVRQCFAKDAEIVRLATRIYERVDFRWMLNGDPLLLSHGWKPESGFLKARWDTYSEDTILYVLAVASPTHPISPAAWYALWRDRYRYEGHNYFTTIGVPLFMHQYAHAWIDYRNRRENRGDRIDYFQNSIAATLAHRAFCINLRHEFPAYGPDVWGITASDSAKGYLAWGGPPRDPDIDGTIVPSAAGGSLMFTPELATQALQKMYETYSRTIYGRYGFVDAFNPKIGWTDTDMIGINVGIILLSAENMRSGNVWRWFMRNREIPRALDRIGLRSRTQPGRPVSPRATETGQAIRGRQHENAGATSAFETGKMLLDHQWFRRGTSNDDGEDERTPARRDHGMSTTCAQDGENRENALEQWRKRWRS